MMACMATHVIEGHSPGQSQPALVGQQPKVAAVREEQAAVFELHVCQQCYDLVLRLAQQWVVCTCRQTWQLKNLLRIARKCVSV